MLIMHVSCVSSKDRTKAEIGRRGGCRAVALLGCVYGSKSVSDLSESVLSLP